MNKRTLFMSIAGAVLLLVVAITLFFVFRAKHHETLEDLKKEPSGTEVVIRGKLVPGSVTYDQTIPIFTFTDEKGAKIQARLKTPVPPNFEKCQEMTLTGYYYMDVFVATQIDADCN